MILQLLKGLSGWDCVEVENTNCLAPGGIAGSADGRFNVLLMGGDSGAGRWGLRPDSLTVASIDAITGRTVLVSLPRNMQDFPFADGSVMAEQFPDGLLEHAYRESSALTDLCPL